MTEMDPDLELVRQCRSDDRDVFESAFFAIYKKYSERVFNISYRILGNRDDALDVTQDSFIKLFKKIKDFREDAKFYTWFYRIVVNLCIDKKRKQGAHPVFMESDHEGSLADLPDGKGSIIDKKAADEHLEKKIQACLLRLTPNLRIVVVLRYIEGMMYSEMAEALECSIGTIKSRLNRAHRSLENLLKTEIDLVRRRRTP